MSLRDIVKSFKAPLPPPKRFWNRYESYVDRANKAKQMEKYILQKDIPGCIAGTIFTYDSVKGVWAYWSKDYGICFGPSVVEGNPEWFKLDEHLKMERFNGLTLLKINDTQSSFPRLLYSEPEMKACFKAGMDAVLDIIGHQPWDHPWENEFNQYLKKL